MLITINMSSSIDVNILLARRHQLQIVNLQSLTLYARARVSVELIFDLKINGKLQSLLI
jgi:hypothetical protein